MLSLSISNDRFRKQKFNKFPCCCGDLRCADVNIAFKYTPYAFLCGEISYKSEYRGILGLDVDPVKEKGIKLVVKLHHFYWKNAMDFWLLKLFGISINFTNVLPVPTNTIDLFLEIPDVFLAYQNLTDENVVQKQIYSIVPLNRHPDIQNLLESLSSIYLSTSKTAAHTEKPKIDEKTVGVEESVQDDIEKQQSSPSNSKIRLVGIQNPSRYCFFTAALSVMLRLEVYFKYTNDN